MNRSFDCDEYTPEILIVNDPPRYRLITYDGLIIVETNKYYPNWWVRIWSLLLLGWKWEKINEQD